MGTFNATLEAAELRAFIADIAQTVTLASGKVVSASVTTGAEADQLGLADVTEERRLTAVIMVADCDVLPVANDVIRYGGKAYRVADPMMHDDGIAITLNAVGEWQ